MRTRTRDDGSYDLIETDDLTGYTRKTRMVKTTTTTDTVTPGYFALVRSNGALPVNQFSSTQVMDEATATPFTLTRKSTGACEVAATGRAYVGHLPVSVAIPEIDEDGLVTQALARAKQPIWDVLTFAAELRSTQALLTSFWSRFESSIRKAFAAYYEYAKRRSKKGGGRAIRVSWDEFTGWWLTTRYGWRPLIMEMKSIQDAITALLSKASKQELRTGASVRSDSATGSKALLSPMWCAGHVSVVSSGDSFMTEIITTQTVEVRKRAFVGFRHSGGLTGTLGLDPLVTAWELVTLSFVVDWFIDIGSWIQSWTPFVNGSVQYCGVSTEIVTTTTTTARRIYRDHPSYLGSPGGLTTYTSITTMKSRRPANYTASVPQVEFDLDWTQLMDLIAIASQLKYGKRFLRYVTG